MVQENPQLFPFRERSREGKVMRKIVAVVVLAMGLSACTPAQIANWMDWIRPPTRRPYVHRPELAVAVPAERRQRTHRPDGNLSVSYAFVA